MSKTKDNLEDILLDKNKILDSQYQERDLLSDEDIRILTHDKRQEEAEQRDY